MSDFWRKWFMAWCMALGLFGVLLAGGAFEATSGPVRSIFALLSGTDVMAFDPSLRFSLAVLGSVLIGWAVTLWFMIAFAIRLGAAGRPIWTGITAALVIWFVIDSALSLATGFGLNVVPNIALAAMYLIGLGRSGALEKQAQAKN